MFTQIIFSCLFVVTAAKASPLYLYTIDFDPTPISAFTSVSYLSQTLLSNTATNFLPAASTSLSLPGQGASLYPGLGAGSISNGYASLAFNRNNSLTWLFQGNTASAITGEGTYAFSQTSLSSSIDPAGTYEPTGRVIVQELAQAPVIFRYTETWNATSQTPGASYYYDSPVFLQGFLPLTGTDIHVVGLPAPGFHPYSQGLFAAGNGVAEAYFVNDAGDFYFYTASFNPTLETLGTHPFTQAGSGFNTMPTSATGSVSITAIAQAPEPATLWTALLSLTLTAGWSSARFRKRLTVR